MDVAKSRPGLRVQILFALASVMLVAYVPLFFAIAQMARSTARAYHEDVTQAAAHDGAQARDSATATHEGATTAREAEIVRRRAALEKRTAGVVRGIALYMFVFALALLTFAYFALTRSIVRPVERLARAADRVANGARSFELDKAAPRELDELGESLRAMTRKLRAEEEALRAKIDELTTTTKRLGEARLILGETREQLADSEHMASVGKLAAGVAHEIGNPIAAIMGLHDLLEDGGLGPGEREDFLRRMRKETERIHHVVRDLLDYARPAPASGSSRAKVDEVLADALALVTPQKEWRNVESTIDVADDLFVPLAPQRLTQIFLNLLLNAGAAIAAAPVAGAKGSRVNVRAERATQGERAIVRIVVEDDGPGVPPELRDRIFDPFVTTKDVGAGTGLGLAVCKGIVEGAAGSLFLDASYTQGARFVVELPEASPGG